MIFRWLTLALLLPGLSGPLFARHLVLGVGLPREHVLLPKLQEYTDRVAEKVDKDLRIELRSTPFLRIQEEVAKGEMDGDLGRLAEVYEGNPEVVRVDEPTSMLNMFLIYNKEQVPANLESLKSQKVLAAKDIYFHKRACMVLALNCEFVGPGSSSMDMLRLKRVGAVIATQYQIAELFRLSGNPELFQLDGKSHYQEPVYLFLAKKNADLARRLGVALKERKRDGTYRKIFGMDP